MKKKSIMSFFWRHGGQKKWLVMKLTALFIFVFSFTLVANTSAQQERVNLNLKNVSIRTLFGEIQKQTALSFVYNMELTQHLGQVSVKAKQEARGKCFESGFSEHGAFLQVRGRHYCDL